MFDETRKYKNNGHFFFKKGDSLSEVSGEVPDLPGVYCIMRLAGGRIDMVYIGSSGVLLPSVTTATQLLRDTINDQQNPGERQEYFDQKMKSEHIDGLDIYWYVTMDNENNDLPEYVEGLLIQRYRDVHGRLPIWNNDLQKQSAKH